MTSEPGSAATESGHAEPHDEGNIAVAVAAMLLMFVATQVLALLLRPAFQEAELQGFEDPTDWTNGLVLIGVILTFTAVFLYIARKRMEALLQWIILGSVGLTIAYVFYALLFSVMSIANVWTGPVWVLEVTLGVLSLAFAFLPTYLLYTFPEWYVVDLVGVLVAAGAISIFGTSFTPLTYLVVLVGTAIYDYISVRKTKHMLSLADSVLDLHLPIMLVVPKGRGYSFLDERGGIREAADRPEPPAGQAGPPKRDAMFLGLGDVVIPSILMISAFRFVGFGATIGAFLGILAGFAVLMTFVLRGKPQPGLPALNGGAFVGFLLGAYLGSGSWTSWISAG